MDYNKFRDRMIKYYKKMNENTSIRLKEPSDELKLAIMVGITVFMEIEELEYEKYQQSGMGFGDLFDDMLDL